MEQAKETVEKPLKELFEEEADKRTQAAAEGKSWKEIDAEIEAADAARRERNEPLEPSEAAAAMLDGKILYRYSDGIGTEAWWAPGIGYFYEGIRLREGNMVHIVRIQGFREWRRRSC